MRADHLFQGEEGFLVPPQLRQGEPRVVVQLGSGTGLRLDLLETPPAPVRTCGYGRA